MKMLPITPPEEPYKTRLTTLQEVLLYCVLFTIPFFRLGTTITGSESLTPAKIFIGLTLLLWITHILIERDSGAIIFLLQEKATLFMLLFMIVTFMSLMFTRYIQDETISELFLRVKTFLLYFLIIAIIHRRRTLKLALIAFLVGSVLTTSAGLYEAVTGDSVFQSSYRHGDFRKAKEGLLETTYGGTGRVQGLYCDAGFHAHAMVVFIGLAIPWVFYGRTKQFRVIMLLLVIAYIVNLIGTGARVGWVSMGFGLAVFLLFMKHRHKYSLWALSVLTVVAVFLGSTLIPHLPTTERLTLKGDISWSWRVDTNLQGFAMVLDHPVLGVGTGNYLVEYFNYLEQFPRLSRIKMGWLHDSYLQIWVENGTVGLIAFMVFLSAIVLGLVKAYFNPVDGEMKTLALGFMTALAAYAVEFSGVPILGQEMGWLLFGLCVAFLGIHRRELRALSVNRKNAL